jgi:hypothetical protein
MDLDSFVRILTVIRGQAERTALRQTTGAKSKKEQGEGVPYPGRVRETADHMKERLLLRTGFHLAL